MSQSVPVFKRVAEHCERLGISGQELARRTGMHPLRAQRLLNGKTRMLADDVELIASATGTTPAELYGEEHAA